MRKYAKELSIEETVECAITECIKEGILAKFLKKNRAEAKKVSIYEYDEEKHLRMEREDAKADGIAEGIQFESNRMNHLILKLSELNRMEDLVKAASNNDYREKLLKEFGL